MLVSTKLPIRLLPIIEAVLVEKQRDPSSQLGVSSGWSSDKRFLERYEENLGELLSLLQRAFALSDICGWANILDGSQQVSWHNHESSHLGGRNEKAGVLFLTNGAPLCIWNGLAYAGGQVVSITPEPGLLVMFGAMQDHCVLRDTRYVGHSRLSLAFNVRAQGSSGIQG